MFPIGEKMFRHQKYPYMKHFFLFLNHRFPLFQKNCVIFAEKQIVQ